MTNNNDGWTPGDSSLHHSSPMNQPSAPQWQGEAQPQPSANPWSQGTGFDDTLGGYGSQPTVGQTQPGPNPAAQYEQNPFARPTGQAPIGAQYETHTQGQFGQAQFGQAQFGQGQYGQGQYGQGQYGQGQFGQGQFGQGQYGQGQYGQGQYGQGQYGQGQYGQASYTAPAQAANKTPLIIAGVAVVVLLATLVTMLVLRSSTTPTQPPTSPQTTQQPTSRPTQPTQTQRPTNQPTSTGNPSAMVAKDFDGKKAPDTVGDFEIASEDAGSTIDNTGSSIAYMKSPQHVLVRFDNDPNYGQERFEGHLTGIKQVGNARCGHNPGNDLTYCYFGANDGTLYFFSSTVDVDEMGQFANDFADAVN